MTLPDPLPIRPRGPIDADVLVPGSKSWTQRAICLAALADGESVIEGWGDNDDVRRCLEAARALGATVDETPGALRVKGPALAEKAELDLGGSGTAFRLMLGVCLSLPGEFVLDGDARLRERPVGELARAASDLGAAVRWLGREGFPPLRISSNGLTPRSVLVDASRSSQFLSALLIAGAAVDAPGLRVQAAGAVASESYVHMTVAALRAFGARVTASPNGWVVAGPLKPAEFVVEPDATGANYFLGAAAATGGRALAVGLSRASLQGDVRFADVLERMGCRIAASRGLEVHGPPQLRGSDADFSLMPDSAPTFAVLAALASSPSRATGCANLRIKESDRLVETAAELRKIGASVDVHEDGWTIRPGPPRPAVILTHGDHRMAMAFALAGLRFPQISISSPQVVSKSFPIFWDLFESLNGSRGGDASP